MAINFNSISESLNGFFGFFGRDQYTQTRTITPRVTNLTKSEQWVDCSYGNLYNLYNTTAELKLVINRKASMFANGRWQHIKNGEIQESSPFVHRLENPNPLMNGNEFLRAESINYDVFGNSFVYSLRGNMANVAPHAFSVLPSQNMIIKRSGKIFKQLRIEDIIEEYEMEINGDKVDSFETKDIIHFKTTNPNDPIIGESLLTSLNMPISNLRGAYGFRNRIIKSNSALGIISGGSADGLGVAFDVDEQSKVNKAHSATYGMQEGKSDFMMTEASINYTPTSYPTKDLLLFEEVDADLKRIIDTYGLNDNIFSFQKASTFSNLEQGIKLAYQDCIEPFAEDRALAFSKSFGMDGINEYMKLDYSHLAILQKDKVQSATADKIKAETFAILTANGNTEEAGKIYEE